jgi:hypothetical protein
MTDPLKGKMYAEVSAWQLWATALYIVCGSWMVLSILDYEVEEVDGTQLKR